MSCDVNILCVYKNILLLYSVEENPEKHHKTVLNGSIPRYILFDLIIIALAFSCCMPGMVPCPKKVDSLKP